MPPAWRPEPRAGVQAADERQRLARPGQVDDIDRKVRLIRQQVADMENKVSFTQPTTGDWAGYFKLADSIGYYIENPATGAIISFDIASATGGMWGQSAPAGGQWWTWGYGINANSRFNITGSHPYEFSDMPYVGTAKMLAMTGNTLVNAANDAAAAGAGIPVGGLYRNGSVVMVRVA